MAPTCGMSTPSSMRWCRVWSGRRFWSASRQSQWAPQPNWDIGPVHWHPGSRRGNCLESGIPARGLRGARHLNPDRIVLGVQDDSTRAEVAVRELYAPLLAAGVPFLVTDLQTAELVKVSANAFLATKISFINAISEVCEAAGADVSQLADALGYDPRIGRQCLNAGLGFGGGCLPKDIRAFMARAGELGADQALTFLREVDSINMRRRTKMVELATTACGGSLLGANIAVLGAAFKPESDDVRDSPALNVAGQLQLNGATVHVRSKGLGQRPPTVPYLELCGFGCGGLRARGRRVGAYRMAGVHRSRTR